jgi:hypothetical protein
MPTILIDAGDETEALLQFIAKELDDKTLDEIEVVRDVAKSENLATEPLTVTATLALATGSLIPVARIIERWMENRKQATQLRIVLEGFQQSDDAGKALADVAKTYSKVSIEYGMPKPQKK